MIGTGRQCADRPLEVGIVHRSSPGDKLYCRNRSSILLRARNNSTRTLFSPTIERSRYLIMRRALYIGQPQRERSRTFSRANTRSTSIESARGDTASG